MKQRPSGNTLTTRGRPCGLVGGIIGLAAISLTLTATIAQADTILYSNLAITDNATYNTVAQNYIGGLAFNTTLWDVQAADDFVLSDTYTINSVTADFVASSGASPANGMLVEFFSDVSGAPSASASISIVTQKYSVTEFSNHLDDSIGLRVTVDMSTAGVVLGSGVWWMAVTPVDESISGNRYSQVRQTGLPLLGNTAFGRNGGVAHGNGYTGGYPSSEWSAFGSFGPQVLPLFQPGDLAMQIQGMVVPAPSVLAVIGLLGLMDQRRRRSYQ